MSDSTILQISPVKQFNRTYLTNNVVKEELLLKYFKGVAITTLGSLH